MVWDCVEIGGGQGESLLGVVTTLNYGNNPAVAEMGEKEELKHRHLFSSWD